MIQSRFGRTLLVLWFAAVLAVIAVSLMSAATLHEIHADSLLANDKVGHFTAYVILAVMPVLAIELLGLGVVLASAMVPLGVLLEFAQIRVPGRSFDRHDMFANTLGVITGVLLAILLRAMLRFTSRPASR